VVIDAANLGRYSSTEIAGSAPLWKVQIGILARQT
jgi:hypothetical protein